MTGSKADPSLVHWMNWKEGRTWQGTLENRCNCFNPYFHFDHNYSFVKGRHVFDIGHTVDVFDVYIYGFPAPGLVRQIVESVCRESASGTDCV